MFQVDTVLKTAPRWPAYGLAHLTKFLSHVITKIHTHKPVTGVGCQILMATLKAYRVNKPTGLTISKKHRM